MEVSVVLAARRWRIRTGWPAGRGGLGADLDRRRRRDTRNDGETATTKSKVVMEAGCDCARVHRAAGANGVCMVWIWWWISMVAVGKCLPSLFLHSLFSSFSFKLQHNAFLTG